MKWTTALALMLVAGQLAGQNNFTKTPSDVSIQITPFSEDTVEFHYNVTYERRTGFRIGEPAPRPQWDFKEQEHFSFRLPAQARSRLVVPPYFLEDTILYSQHIKYESLCCNLSYYTAYFLDEQGEKMSYTDSVGNGTFMLVPETEGPGYKVSGAFQLYQRTYAFEEVLELGETLKLNPRLALALKLEHVEDNQATIWVGLDLLNTSKEKPSIPGNRFYAYALSLNSEMPITVGWDAKGRTAYRDYLHKGQKFTYLPAFFDRAENGSFLLQDLGEGRFHLTGVYAYYNRLFVIDHELPLGGELGVSDSFAIPYEEGRQ